MKYTKVFNDVIHIVNRRVLQHVRVRIAATVEPDDTISALYLLRGVVPNTGWVPSDQPKMKFDAPKPEDVSLWRETHPNIFIRERYARALPRLNAAWDRLYGKIGKLQTDFSAYPLDGKWFKEQPIPAKEETRPRHNPWPHLPDGHFLRHEIQGKAFEYKDVAPKDLDRLDTCTLFMGAFYVKYGDGPAVCFGQIRLGNPQYPNLGLECKDSMTWNVYKVGQVRPVRPDATASEFKTDAEILCTFTNSDSIANPIAHTSSDNLGEALKFNDWFKIIYQLGVKHPELPTLSRLLALDEMIHGVNAHQTCQAHEDRYAAWTACQGTDAEKLEAFLNRHPYKLPEGDPS